LELIGFLLLVAPPFSARGMARLLNISLRQLERAFVESFGFTPQQWLDQVRLWYACSLLLEGRPSKQIIGDLGFKTLTGFSHAFKRYHGCTPRGYVLYHLHSETNGLRKLRESTIRLRQISVSPAASQHLAAQNDLNQLLWRSKKLTLYFNYSPCRSQAMTVAQKQ
jgi:AraC-like DNA-binding protein